MQQAEDIRQPRRIDIARFRTVDLPVPSPDGADSTYRRVRYMTLDVLRSTHIDTIRKLDAYGTDKVLEVAGLKPAQFEQIRHQTYRFCSPISVPLIVLNVADKAQRLWEIVHGESAGAVLVPGEAALLPAHLAFEDAPGFRELFLSLCITRKEIQRTLSGCELAHAGGAALAFYTDWAGQFDCSGRAEFYGLHEMWHPFLMHPYLDVRSLDYVMNDLRIVGVGTDAPTLEAPVYYCSLQAPLVPSVRSLRESLVNGISGGGVELPRQPFLHIRCLCSGVFLLESLHFGDLVPPDVRYITGHIDVTPICSDAGDWECVLARVDFVKEGESS